MNVAPEFNERVVLAARPDGLPRESDFKLETVPLPQLAAGEVLVRGIWLSVDPYVRGLIAGVYPHLKRIEIGETLRGGVVGEVLQSRDPAFQLGDIVEGRLGW